MLRVLEKLFKRAHSKNYATLRHAKLFLACNMLGFPQGRLFAKGTIATPCHLRYHTFSLACCCASRGLSFWHLGAQLTESLGQGWCRSCPCRARRSLSRCETGLTCSDKSKSGQSNSTHACIHYQLAFELRHCRLQCCCWGTGRHIWHWPVHSEGGCTARRHSPAAWPVS